MADNYFISKATWPDQKSILFSVRQKVFVIEQVVAQRLEWDEKDHLCSHFIEILILFLKVLSSWGPEYYTKKCY